jgi:hypothetical protein
MKIHPSQQAIDSGSKWLEMVEDLTFSLSSFLPTAFPVLLCFPTASISSIKTMEGASLDASSNNFPKNVKIEKISY